MSPTKLFNDRNPKCLEKEEENGVSTPHVLSMRPYAHVLAKHTKKGLLVKTCHFTPLRTYCTEKQVLSTNKTCLHSQHVILIPTYLKP